MARRPACGIATSRNRRSLDRGIVADGLCSEVERIRYSDSTIDSFDSRRSAESGNIPAYSGYVTYLEQKVVLIRPLVLMCGAMPRVLVVLAMPSPAFFHRAPEWPALKQSVREHHPSVPQLATEALHAWLADAARTQPVLLDARAPAEYQVSRLKDARLASDLEAALRVLEGRAKDVPIVVYCSVGVRSSALAEKLIRAGWRNVSNLEGSIFEWANLGYPLFRGAEPASKVHPYNDNWGKLLERRLWAEPE